MQNYPIAYVAFGSMPIKANSEKEECEEMEILEKLDQLIEKKEAELNGNPQHDEIVHKDIRTLITAMELLQDHMDDMEIIEDITEDIAEDVRELFDENEEAIANKPVPFDIRYEEGYRQALVDVMNALGYAVED